MEIAPGSSSCSRKASVDLGGKSQIPSVVSLFSRPTKTFVFRRKKAADPLPLRNSFRGCQERMQDSRQARLRFGRTAQAGSLERQRGRLVGHNGSRGGSSLPGFPVCFCHGLDGVLAVSAHLRRPAFWLVCDWAQLETLRPLFPGGLQGRAPGFCTSSGQEIGFWGCVSLDRPGPTLSAPGRLMHVPLRGPSLASLAARPGWPFDSTPPIPSSWSSTATVFLALFNYFPHHIPLSYLDVRHSFLFHLHCSLPTISLCT